MNPLRRIALSRRTFLRGCGVSLALPLLDAMIPAAARGADLAATPKRLVFVGRNLGLHPPFLFPKETGRDYTPTPYLKLLADHRRDMTIFSGLSHPNYPAGHSGDIALLTGAPFDAIRNPRNLHNTISADQVAAEVVGDKTRFTNMALGGWTLSWSRNGTRLPADGRVDRVFRDLFIDGKPDEVQRAVRDLRDGRSIMDTLGDETRSLQRRVGPADRDKLDRYFTAVREAELRLAQNEVWASKPKPKVDMKPPKYLSDEKYLIEKSKMWYDVMHLALAIDSTRIITLWLGQNGSVQLPGEKAPTSLTHHELSHHGQDPAKIEELSRIEAQEVMAFDDFLTKLKGSGESAGSLLDHTQVFFGSNLSNANSHSNQNLPILLAGGGYKHGQHVAFDKDNNTPLCNLYLSMLQKFGVETDAFGTSSGNLNQIA
ncbi:MAG: DUF1552 domain-containing protein [Planctomycetes bacterium]|nr:DUF1552 domain-containing protein [Planctomycetota bacterium]